MNSQPFDGYWSISTRHRTKEGIFDETKPLRRLQRRDRSGTRSRLGQPTQECAKECSWSWTSHCSMRCIRKETGSISCERPMSLIGFYVFYDILTLSDRYLMNNVQTYLLRPLSPMYCTDLPSHSDSSAYNSYSLITKPPGGSGMIGIIGIGGSSPRSEPLRVRVARI
jgi:hypothetical protein